MTGAEFKLEKDCKAKLIPAGDEMILPAGTPAIVTQALGGSVTLRTDMGLFRVESDQLDALGDAIANEIAALQSHEEEITGEFGEEKIWNALRQCFDPEIPVNIVDLGLIYDLQISEPVDGKHEVAVKMTLTAQGCGMGPTIAADAKEKIEGLPEVSNAQVDIVWDPQWTPHMISPEGRQKLGLD